MRYSYKEQLAKRCADLQVLMASRQVSVAIQKEPDAKKDILEDIGRTILAAKRKTPSMPMQEALRIELTWHDFGRTIREFCFYEEEQKERLAYPAEWKAKLASMVLGLEDETQLCKVVLPQGCHSPQRGPECSE